MSDQDDRWFAARVGEVECLLVSLAGRIALARTLEERGMEQPALRIVGIELGGAPAGEQRLGAVAQRVERRDVAGGLGGLAVGGPAAAGLGLPERGVEGAGAGRVAQLEVGLGGGDLGRRLGCAGALGQVLDGLGEGSDLRVLDRQLLVAETDLTALGGDQRLDGRRRSRVGLGRSSGQRFRGRQAAHEERAEDRDLADGPAEDFLGELVGGDVDRFVAQLPPEPGPGGPAHGLRFVRLPRNHRRRSNCPASIAALWHAPRRRRPSMTRSGRPVPSVASLSPKSA